MSEHIEVLKADDAALRSIFMRVLEHHHKDLAVKFNEVFAQSSAWCDNNEEAAFEELEQSLEELKPSHSILVRPRTSVAPAAALRRSRAVRRYAPAFVRSAYSL